MRKATTVRTPRSVHTVWGKKHANQTGSKTNSRLPKLRALFWRFRGTHTHTHDVFTSHSVFTSAPRPFSRRSSRVVRGCISRPSMDRWSRAVRAERVHHGPDLARNGGRLIEGVVSPMVALLDDPNGLPLTTGLKSNMEPIMAWTKLV